MISTVNSYYGDYRNPEYVKEFKKYIKNVRKSWENDPDSQAKSREVLKETGIADENGHIKERIISWE